MLKETENGIPQGIPDFHIGKVQQGENVFF